MSDKRVVTQRGLWFEEFETGVLYQHRPGRTITEAAVTATRHATQVFGGYGFMDETPVSRHYRDSKILEIGEGTSEVQRMLIARDLGLARPWQ